MTFISEERVKRLITTSMLLGLVDYGFEAFQSKFFRILNSHNECVTVGDWDHVKKAYQQGIKIREKKTS